MTADPTATLPAGPLPGSGHLADRAAARQSTTGNPQQYGNGSAAVVGAAVSGVRGDGGRPALQHLEHAANKLAVMAWPRYHVAAIARVAGHRKLP